MGRFKISNMCGRPLWTRSLAEEGCLRQAPLRLPLDGLAQCRQVERDLEVDRVGLRSVGGDGAVEQALKEPWVAVEGRVQIVLLNLCIILDVHYEVRFAHDFFFAKTFIVEADSQLNRCCSFKLTCGTDYKLESVIELTHAPVATPVG